MVVDLPPARDEDALPQPDYTMEARTCFNCWRDFRLYVPTGRQGSLLVIEVPCPHCRRYRAETIVPRFRAQVLVQASERTWLEWKIRSIRRRARIAWAWTRVGVAYARRALLVVRRTKRVRSTGETR